MAVDMFLKLTGIKGEAKDHKHAGEVDVLAWSWGASNSASSHTGGGGGAGKVNVQDLSLTKWVDISSTELFYHCASGKHIPEAVLVVRKAGENPLEYLTITLTDVLISSLSTGGSGGEDRLTENITINFSKVKIAYKEQSAKGAAAKGVESGWDIKANKKL
jgi:type VI secretion system secreted protein Hcp